MFSQQYQYQQLYTSRLHQILVSRNRLKNPAFLFQANISRRRSKISRAAHSGTPLGAEKESEGRNSEKWTFEEDIDYR